MKILHFFKEIFVKQLPVYYIVIILLIVAGGNYYYLNQYALANNSQNLQKIEYNTCITKMSQVRTKDFKFVHPLLLTDIPNESEDLLSLKNEINTFIESKKSIGEISNASVYFRELNDGSWMNINGNEGFHPGSLIKIPILLTYLKYAEDNPTLLNKQIKYEKVFSNMPTQEFPDKMIQVGKSYKANELLEAMIENSDNAATMLLIQNVNMNGFKKLFTDIGLPEPPENSPNFSISAVDVSKFLRILYSSTYLKTASSEYALTLLSKSTFQLGIAHAIPKEISIVHKFGEQGTPLGKELHEIAIIYLNNNPYLLTIMTQGKEMDKLPPILSEISKITYNHLNINM